MLDDAVKVAVLVLQYLVQPVHHLHIRVAPQLAKYRRALYGLVAQRIQFAEKRNTVDVRHWVFSCVMVRNPYSASVVNPVRADRVFPASSRRSTLSLRGPLAGAERRSMIAQIACVAQSLRYCPSSTRSSASRSLSRVPSHVVQPSFPV